jgi:hypothetical protein
MSPSPMLAIRTPMHFATTQAVDMIQPFAL